MPTQTQQQTATENIPAQAGHNGQFTHSNRGAYTPGYQQGNRPDLTTLFNGLNIQNPGSGGKYNTMKGGMPVAMPPPMELAGPRSYNNGLVLLPNGGVFQGMPPVSPIPPFPQAALPGHDQVGQIPYLPNMYPGLAPGCVPAAMQGYPFPYPMMNCDMQDPTGQKRNQWSSNEEQKGANPSVSDGGNQSEFLGSAPGFDGSTLSNYSMNSLPQGGQGCLQFQMMKTPTGYILQDLESLVQQEPAIPRAVPAMWTNPTDLTLAKCLENREGITNVYIRGFLPETTDEALLAYASRFGKIDRCKAIVDLDTGLCKGFVSPLQDVGATLIFIPDSVLFSTTTSSLARTASADSFTWAIRPASLRYVKSTLSGLLGTDRV